jgi:hypothetical protein
MVSERTVQMAGFVLRREWTIHRLFYSFNFLTIRDEKQHVVGHRPAQRQHLRGQEVGPDQQRQMSTLCRRCRGRSPCRSAGRSLQSEWRLGHAHARDDITLSFCRWDHSMQRCYAAHWMNFHPLRVISIADIRPHDSQPRPGSPAGALLSWRAVATLILRQPWWRHDGRLGRRIHAPDDRP